tara:strand:- start:39 stop:653 length:615 start_codon:yes stop_codon:yes gene_type:complete
MANTTFSGPVRSQGGFFSISKNASTGAVTTLSSISSTGVSSFDANKLATEAGAGITGGTGTVYKSSVQRVGGIIVTEIFIDLTGLRSPTNGTLIGVNGTSDPVHIGQITTAQNGLIFAGSMEGFEGTSGGTTRIDVNDSANGALVTGNGHQTTLLDGTGVSAGSKEIFTVLPSPDRFLYLATGASSVADYTAGKILITLVGYQA